VTELALPHHQWFSIVQYRYRLNRCPALSENSPTKIAISEKTLRHFDSVAALARAASLRRRISRGNTAALEVPRTDVA
jgi:hypothetical protein